ncbi:cysteine peptidase family C39 domain-containing protein [Thermodesulfobacteriota bacterium]
MVRIPVTINILLIGFFLVFGILVSRKAIKKYPDLKLETVLKKIPSFYILLPVPAIVFGINKFLQYKPTLLWNVPLWLQYHYSSITWGMILGLLTFIFSFASFLAIKTDHRQKYHLIVAGLIFITAIQSAQWVYTRPIAPQLEEKVNRDSVIIQTSFVSCGAAAAANILKAFGINKTEKEMANLFGTSVINGTSAAQVVYGMRKLGFNCRMKFDENRDTLIINPPALLYFGKGTAWAKFHAVAFMGYQDGKAEIRDPINGKAYLTKEQLEKEWSGYCIEFQKI